MIARLWAETLGDHEDLIGLNFSWLALDGSLNNATLGEKTGPNPTERAKGGVKRSKMTKARGITMGLVLDGTNRHDVKLVDSTMAS